MTVNALPSNEYGSFYANYISLVPEGMTVVRALEDSKDSLLAYLENVGDDRQDFAYAPRKWTIKQSLQHIIDTDRIFAYRALRLARHDATPLPGFEQDDYAAHADLSAIRLTDLITEFSQHRLSMQSMFSGFTGEDLRFTGTVSNHPMSCRAMGFIIAGHTFHHRSVFDRLYL
ncbi:DinB family protein [Lewinella sp. IMCC34191]|uniref:DinB family protein n=1 Tax=Lewinella sp. IMCC34191 TaxID=2259172 RepID=UPI000E2562C1|nr:DinB family protein [Lewinella sp. IMCC34191]